MPITKRRPASPARDNQTAEAGTVECVIDGNTYVGSYVVHAFGRGKERYRVNSDKQVTVTYEGRSKSAMIGGLGAEGIAEVLLGELVTDG